MSKALLVFMLAVIMASFASLTDAKVITYEIKPKTYLEDIIYMAHRDYGANLKMADILKQYPNLEVRKLPPGTKIAVNIPDKDSIASINNSAAVQAVNVTITRIDRAEKNLTKMFQYAGIAIGLLLVLSIYLLFKIRTTRGPAISFKAGSELRHFYPNMRKGKYLALKRAKPTWKDLLSFRWFIRPLYDLNAMRKHIIKMFKDPAVESKYLKNGRLKVVKVSGAQS